MALAPWKGSPQGSWPWEDTSRRVRVVLVYGESRGANHAEGTAICWPEMVAQLSPSRVFMMNNVRAPGLPYEADFLGPEASSLTPLMDCRYGNRAEGWSGSNGDPIGQSLSAFAYHLDSADITAGRPLRRTIFLVTGVGGRKSYELTYDAPDWEGRFGTFQIYDRSLRAVERARDLASALWDQDVSVEFVLFLQGFNDLNAPGGATPADVWQETVQTGIFAPYDTDIPAITGQTETIYFLFEQTPPGLNGEPNPVCLGQVAMANDNFNGRTYLGCVSYGLPTNTRDTDQSTTAHQTARGVTVQGETFGHAAVALIEGGQPERCYIPANGVRRVGNTLILSANRPVVADTSSFPDPGSFGLQLRRSDGSLIVGGLGEVSVVGNDIIAPILPAYASQAATIEYSYERVGGELETTSGVPWTDGETDMAGSAAQTPGAYGCIRASDWTQESAFVSAASGSGSFIIKLWLEIGQWQVPQ